MPGEIASSLGSTMYEVQLADGQKVRKHADQLKSRIPVESGASSTGEETDSEFDARIPHSDDSDNTTPAEPDDSNDSEETETSQELSNDTPESETIEKSSSPPKPRRST